LQLVTEQVRYAINAASAWFCKAVKQHWKHQALSRKGHSGVCNWYDNLMYTWTKPLVIKVQIANDNINDKSW
jgi:hypothetical protein